jgi:hypothetical protein
MLFYRKNCSGIGQVLLGAVFNFIAVFHRLFAVDFRDLPMIIVCYAGLYFA